MHVQVRCTRVESPREEQRAPREVKPNLCGASWACGRRLVEVRQRGGQCLCFIGRRLGLQQQGSSRARALCDNGAREASGCVDEKDMNNNNYNDNAETDRLQ